MKLNSQFSLASFLFLTQASIGAAAEPSEPLLRDLPPGLAVESSSEIPSAQTTAIGRKLGGELVRLTNSVVRVHGRSLQVNVLNAKDEANATAILATLAKTKPDPFCVRKGTTVVEYVGKDIDAALALKTCYELGLRPKPQRVRYRVVAELATVDKADFMACNPLFDAFLALQGGGGPEAVARIHDLTKRFQFGQSLALRNPEISRVAADYRFQPDALRSRNAGSAVVYSFADLPKREGVPYATATLEITVDDTGFLDNPTSPGPALTASTAFWPTGDPAIAALARRITEGKTTNEAKVAAILEWLTPGRNLGFSGQTGSRWGTAKVLAQKFGHCWDSSDCFITLARAAGVPSRQVAGWFYGSSGHVWAEFYREGKGWQQVDPTGGGKLRCGIYHIPYFTSDDGDMPVLYVAMPKIEVAEPQ